MASDVTVVPENGEHAFSSRSLSLEFFSFVERWDDDNSSDWLYISGL
jgi:hypothetical protein